jgi:hypothetical protein
MADPRTLPAGPAVAGGWTAEQQADHQHLIERRAAAPEGSAEHRMLSAWMWRMPTDESTGRRRAEGL